MNNARPTQAKTETPGKAAFFSCMLDALSDAEDGSAYTEEASALLTIAQERLESEMSWFDKAPKIAAIEAFIERSKSTFVLIDAIMRTLDEARLLLAPAIARAYELTYQERDRTRAAAATPQQP